ncbi:Cupredoxin [Limtongia smithiae]|uniref:Cupredoxin n=1 Tax=Limtongia smithiae TaxID=1125753 RepID=UPI0034CEE8C8
MKTTMSTAAKTTVAVAGVLAMASTASAYTVHAVTAGLDAFSFQPDSITADVGDYVVFTVTTGSHGIAQSTYDSPCSPYSDSTGVNGIFSGILSPTGDVNLTYTIRINTTDPIWFYCPEAYHCQSGMTGVINPLANESLSDYTALAAEQTYNTQPSVEVGNTTIGAENSTTSSNTSSSSTSSASSSSSSSATATTLSSVTTSASSAAASTTSANSSTSSTASASATATTSVAAALKNLPSSSSAISVALLVAAGIRLFA